MLPLPQLLPNISHYVLLLTAIQARRLSGGKLRPAPPPPPVPLLYLFRPLTVCEPVSNFNHIFYVTIIPCGSSPEAKQLKAFQPATHCHPPSVHLLPPPPSPVHPFPLSSSSPSIYLLLPLFVHRCLPPSLSLVLYVLFLPLPLLLLLLPLFLLSSPANFLSSSVSSVLLASLLFCYCYRRGVTVHSFQSKLFSPLKKKGPLPSQGA